MLKDLKLKGVYRSEDDNLLEDFYLPCLRQSVSYDRAVGFFSAQMLSYAAQGISALVEVDGSMRLIFGGELSEEDAAAIEDGYEQKSIADKLGKVFIGEIENIGDALTRNRLETLSWLIASGRLEIRVALKQKGMYHEKIGIFRDSIGDQVVFQGSANETVYALLPDFNFESVSVYPTWREEFKEHYLPFIDGFERLWINKTKNTVVLSFPEAAREKLIKIAKSARFPAVRIEEEHWRKILKPSLGVAEEKVAPRAPEIYKGSPFELRAHQRNALNAWKAQDFQGILAMATGAGKTLTAIYGLVKIFEATSPQRLFIVIGVPYQSLADQWVDDLALFKINAIRCYADRSSWNGELSKAISLFQAGALPIVSCVVVNRTLQSAEFQQRMSQVPGGALAFVGDECHHYGSKILNDSLPRHARIRLGLSATPEHYLNFDITDRVLSYFGQIAFRYELKDALQDGVLTPYRYFPHLVELTDDEAHEYAELSAKISQAAVGVSAEQVESSSDAILKSLLMKRARLLGNAEKKIALLEILINKTKPSPFYLFYCGDGAVEGDDGDGSTRQVDLVSSALYRHGWKVSHFTSRESREDRKQILERFRIGLVEGLVAIRCLDEGIDVPDCRVAYVLASSRNPKQFIQRRGRILRRSPGKNYAVIHDFVVQIPSGIAGASALERSLLISELTRVSEFAALSENRSEAFQVLKPLLTQHDLLHFLV